MFKIEDNHVWKEYPMSVLMEIILIRIISNKGEGNYFNKKSFH